MIKIAFHPEFKLSFGVSRSLNVFVLFLLFAVFAVLAPTAHAATYTVTNLNNAGVGSLRQAVIDANAAVGADIITFSISGTITLASTLPNITAAGGALTIDGTGQTVTISGNNTVQVAYVDSGAALTLNNLTIANGSNSGFDGGGIYNNGGTLTITNSTFSGNSANNGGGGIYNNGGTLTITNSTFSGNSANSGGGIANGGSVVVSITNSTFSGNSATGLGGGGIYKSAGTLTITNSTFSGNNANQGGTGGGIWNYNGSLTVTNSTFSGNSASSGAGGIYRSIGTVTLLNTIVVNSTGGNCGGTIINGGNNIEDGTTCGWGSVNGSMSSIINPMLGPLAANGGPTQTMALLIGSPAIDGVTFNSPNSAPATDQRGVARPQGSGYDIGAYEFMLESVPTMTEWGMIVFMVLAGLGSMAYLRKQRKAER
jgi:hypothetical protein